MTSPELVAVLEELKLREPIFHHPEFGTTRRDYENMTDLQFWEVGASGRRYSSSDGTPARPPFITWIAMSLLVGWAAR